VRLHIDNGKVLEFLRAGSEGEKLKDDFWIDTND